MQSNLSRESIFNKSPKNVKKIIYVLILPLIMLSGLASANRETKNSPSKKLSPKPLSVAVSKAELKKWEASAKGKKVHTGADKIRSYLNTYTNMEAVIISIFPPSGSSGDFYVVVRINGDDYLLNNVPRQLPKPES